MTIMGLLKVFFFMNVTSHGLGLSQEIVARPF